MDSASAMVGAGVRFERIRRITGYLVGTTARFNNAKRAEERDRVKHVALAAWPGREAACPEQKAAGQEATEQEQRTAGQEG